VRFLLENPLKLKVMENALVGIYKAFEDMDKTKRYWDYENIEITKLEEKRSEEKQSKMKRWIGRVLRRSRRTATGKTSPITPPCLINATATATTNTPIVFQDFANLPSTMSPKDLEALKLVINKCGFGRLDGDETAKDKLEALIYELKRYSYELEQVTRVQESKDRFLLDLSFSEEFRIHWKVINILVYGEC
jgi:hypothetical protein